MSRGGRLVLRAEEGVVVSGTEEELLRQIDVRVKRALGDDPDTSTKICFLKKGPRAYKVASLRSWISSHSGEVKTREFKVQTYYHSKIRGFGGAERAWSCNDEEIEALRTFLNSNLSQFGRYRLVRSSTDIDIEVISTRKRELSPATRT